MGPPGRVAITIIGDPVAYEEMLRDGPVRRPYGAKVTKVDGRPALKGAFLPESFFMGVISLAGDFLNAPFTGAEAWLCGAKKPLSRRGATVGDIVDAGGKVYVISHKETPVWGPDGLDHTEPNH